MRTFPFLATALCLASAPRAFVAADQVVLNDKTNWQNIKNVAIIGAGSAGSSAAYYLRKYSHEQGIPLNITVFERDDHVGGRCTTVDVYDDGMNPAELGASIFVTVNQNLVEAVKEFNLSTSGMDELRSEGPVLAVWNGKDFVFSQATDSMSWWDTTKLFWKYGLAPLKTINLMKATVGKFLKMYEEPYFPWESLSQVAYDLGLTAVTASTGEQYLQQNGIGKLFANEIIQASTRVNYAQNLPLIHGLEAMVCMATDGAMAVEGGNWQIFAHMLQSSGAAVHLNTSVSSLVKHNNSSYAVSIKQSHSEDLTEHQAFDEVILAGPRQFSNIKFDPEPQHMPDEIPYVKLHVTLFTSKHLLSPLAFNLPADAKVPQVILTTLPPEEHPGSSREGVGSPGFFSISLLRPTIDTRPGKGQLEYLYKVFSPAPLNSTFFQHILGLPIRDEIAEEDISWVHRKVWDSYPYEYPRITFEELRLDERLWYTSGIESFISTMETSSLMGKNVAKLIVNRWAKEDREEAWATMGEL